ncbi:MAG: PEGA domain-containing protein [Pseudomonadota bacterium]
MKALRGTLHGRGLIRLSVASEPTGAAFTVDGAAHPEITETPAERWLPPGDVVVAATLEGRSGTSTAVTLAVGRAASVALELPEPPRTGRITVDAPPGAQISVGGRPAAPGEARELPPGDHEIRVELSGHQLWLDTVSLAPGADLRVIATPVPLPPPGRGKGQRVAGWVTLAAGGAALVAGGVMAGLGVKGMQDANASHDAADGGYVRDYGAGRDLYHGGLGTLGGGAAAALTGGLLLLLAPEDSRDE